MLITKYDKILIKILFVLKGCNAKQLFREQGCICREVRGVVPPCTQQLIPWIQLKNGLWVHFNPPYSL